MSDVVDYVCQQEFDDKILVLFKLNLSNSSIEDSLKKLGLKGFSRIKVDSEIIRLDSIEDYSEIDMSKTIYVVIDRLVVNLDKDNLNRLADSIQIAFFEGNGECTIEVVGKKIKAFSNRFELDGISFETPSEHLFSFNNPYGACKNVKVLALF